MCRGSKCKDTGPSTFKPLLYGYNNYGKPFLGQHKNKLNFLTQFKDPPLDTKYMYVKKMTLKEDLFFYDLNIYKIKYKMNESYLFPITKKETK